MGARHNTIIVVCLLGTHRYLTKDHDGAIGIGTMTDTGKMPFTELRRIRTSRKADKVGTFRWYNHYRLPDHLDGGVITVRLHGNDEDTVRKFNRTENVRPIPPSDADFRALYARRNDVESVNRAFDDTLWLRRARSVGQAPQRLNPLTYALAVNTLALHRHRRTSKRPAAPGRSLSPSTPVRWGFGAPRRRILTPRAATDCQIDRGAPNCQDLRSSDRRRRLRTRRFSPRSLPAPGHWGWRETPFDLVLAGRGTQVGNVKPRIWERDRAAIRQRLGLGGARSR